MGPAADGAGGRTKPGTDRSRNDSNILSDQPNRRPVAERHMSRNSANPEDVILAPPKTSFMSATSIRNSAKTFDSTERPSLRDPDSRDRFSFRNKASEGDGERPRESRNNTLRPKRAEGEDSDGWSTVKPRKSFGTEGAERFNGRMGVAGHREERRFKDREDRDGKDRPRGFDTFSRDRVERDGDNEQERDNRRNGNGRGRNEPSWFKDRDTTDQPSTPRERNSNGDRFGVDRNRGWREKERDERPDRGGDRGDRDRGDRGDRRWDRDRDQRQEREPEWMDAPAEEKSQAHTQEEFQKWKEQMQGKDKPAKEAVEETAPQPDAGGSFFELESKKKVETPLAIDTGPDKFFGMWATPKDENPPDLGMESKKEGPAKAKTIGKASRFTSFFTPQEDPQRRQTEPSAPVPSAPLGGLGALFASPSSGSQNTQGDAEREAFQQLLQKLQSHSVGANSSTPPITELQQRKPPAVEKPQSIPPPEPFQQYRPERQEEVRPSTRNSQQALQDFVAQRQQMTGSQPIVRPEQVLQELVGQRQNANSQASARPDQPQSRNSNTEFLMNLMQSAKAAPEPQRTEQVLLRNPGKMLDRQMQQQIMEQEQLHREALQRERERSVSQRQVPTQPPPGFYDDPTAFQRGPPQHERQPGQPPQQPTAILRRPMDRPTPPGLDMGWDRQAQLLPQQHRILQGPPPGLPSGRGMSMPHYPPGFPMGDFPPPNMMAGPTGPPRNMHPPPGFFNAPPPGFMPPGMSGFQEMTFPFDGRGPPPNGAYRRQ